MATATENTRTSAMRESISKTITEGVSLISPTVYVLLNGVPSPRIRIPLGDRALKHVKWAQGGSSYDWRVKKYRSKANTSTGPLRTRTFVPVDLFANPSITMYMHDQTWGVGEGDLEANRHAGPQKIIDIKKESFTDAVSAVQTEIAYSVWNVNATNQAGGLGMLSPTSVAASTTYGGIAMDASTTNGTDTFYYWRPQGYGYGTKTIAGNLPELIGALKRQMTFSADSSGKGKRLVPDFAACDETLWPYLLAYYDSKASFNIDKAANLNLLEDGKFENIVINGITMFWDEYFGGATGYVEAAATTEFLMGTSSEFELVTTHTKAEGLIVTHTTGKTEMAWLAGQGGVAITGKQAPVFRNPRSFQVCYDT